MDSKDLRKLQLCILDIAIEFRRICEKYNISYFLIGGTLLGAVRHHGFIPWDDDMDVGMLREDYERFSKVVAKELDRRFFWQTYQTDEKYAHGFGKIRLNHTVLLEDYARNSGQHNGIYLDVFPYDIMPKNAIDLKIKYLRFKFLKWAALGKTDYSFVDKKKKIFADLSKCLLFFYCKKTCLDKANRICTGKLKGLSYNDNVINWYGAYKLNEYMDYKKTKHLVDLEFEGELFKVPAQYDELLRNMYGDYMQLPPVEKRGIQHSMIKICFGGYIPSKSDK